MQTIVSVAQTSQGTWVMLVDGARLGDARAQPTKEAAQAYAKKIAGNWLDTKFDF